MFVLLAIAVPAAALAALGYVSLRQWERSADLLFREQARDLASMTVDKIEIMLGKAEEDLLARLQAAVATREPRARVLDRLVADSPLIERLYLFDRQGRLLYPASAAAADAALFTGLLAEVSQGFWERGGRRQLAAGSGPALATVVKGADGASLLAAFTWSADGLQREIFDKTVKTLEGTTICAVIDEHGQPVSAREAIEGAELIIALPFRQTLGSWRLALYQAPGASPRHAVRRMVGLFTAALGLLVVVIVAGIIATVRLVGRETEVARLKSDFVANVSHDLKTPLSVIRMFGETLEMGRVTDPARQQEYYRVITRESERLSRLIENVLDFSRIESGRRLYEIVPAALEPLLRETVEAFSYPIGQHGLKLELDVAPDLPDVPMDGEAVGQAIANLVDNAIKYSGDQGTIRVRACVVDGHVACTVADEGIGIPPEEQGRIFEKFYRVGRSDTEGRRGSGVGLALVRHVAEAHGGRVTVDSAPGHGSRFTLWLPLPEVR